LESGKSSEKPNILFAHQKSVFLNLLSLALSSKRGDEEVPTMKHDEYK